jgi:ribosomal protein L12E/L44/L45/RPP1/RPP2
MLLFILIIVILVILAAILMHHAYTSAKLIRNQASVSAIVSDAVDKETQAFNSTNPVTALTLCAEAQGSLRTLVSVYGIENVAAATDVDVSEFQESIRVHMENIVNHIRSDYPDVAPTESVPAKIPSFPPVKYQDAEEEEDEDEEEEEDESDEDN